MLPTLLEVTKIQILKVIHNTAENCKSIFCVVGSHKDTNFESNSQHIQRRKAQDKVVCNHKDTNFESNSQRYFGLQLTNGSCWKSQRYKF